MEETDQSREDLRLPGRIDWQEPGNLRERVCPEAFAKQTYTPPTSSKPPRTLWWWLCAAADE